MDNGRMLYKTNIREIQNCFLLLQRISIKLLGKNEYNEKFWE